MGTKRVELTHVELAEILMAIRETAKAYTDTSDSRERIGWSDSAAMWRRSAKRLDSILVKFEDCDRVAIETDDMGGYSEHIPSHTAGECRWPGADCHRLGN